MTGKYISHVGELPQTTGDVFVILSNAEYSGGGSDKYGQDKLNYLNVQVFTNRGEFEAELTRQVQEAHRSGYGVKPEPVALINGKLVRPKVQVSVQVQI